MYIYELIESCWAYRTNGNRLLLLLWLIVRYWSTEGCVLTTAGYKPHTRRRLTETDRVCCWASNFKHLATCTTVVAHAREHVCPSELSVHDSLTLLVAVLSFSELVHAVDDSGRDNYDFSKYFSTNFFTLNTKFFLKLNFRFELIKYKSHSVLLKLDNLKKKFAAK